MKYLFTLFAFCTSIIVAKAQCSTYIIAQPADTVCAGTDVYLSAHATNGSGIVNYTEWDDGTGPVVIPSQVNDVTLNATTTYYVTVYLIGGCVTHDTFTVYVNPLPSVPTATTPVTYCPNAAAAPLTAVGDSLRWYTIATGGTYSTTAPSPATTVAGTTSYYVSQVINGCESQRVPVDAVVVNNCDSVWPGDANSDFLVDANDVLEIGLAYGQTGAYRSNPSLAFTAQACTDWLTNLPTNNNNAKHADCDGDGTITAADTTAVSLNYGMVHSKQTHHAQSKITGLPNLYFGPANAAGEVPVYFGDAGSSMSNVYGLSAKINVTGNVTAPATIRFNNTSWLGDSTQTINFQKQVNDARTDMAIVRNTQTTATGNGPIAWLRLSPADPVDTLSLYFSDVRVIDNNGTVLTGYNVMDDTLVTTAIATTMAQNAAAVIVPNPSSSRATLQLTIPQPTQYHLILTDAMGRTLWTATAVAGAGKNTVVLPAGIPAGAYNLTLQLAGGAAPASLRWLKLQ